MKSPPRTEIYINKGLHLYSLIDLRFIIVGFPWLIILQTPLSYYEDWYDSKRRKPNLQIRILKMITNKGRLAICEAESSLGGQRIHKEVWQSFKDLEDNPLTIN